MNADDIRLLAYYVIPNSWNIHLIDRRTDEKQLKQIEEIIENAYLLAFDTETMPSFYQNQNTKWHSSPYQTQQNFINKPSLLQVAVQNKYENNKHVLLFDLQELFDSSFISFHNNSTNIINIIETLIELILNHPHAIKLSQSLYNDLAYLKCSFNENCFQHTKLLHVIELSDIYRKVFPDEKQQEIYSLQRMTARTLHYQLNKKQQCANWSKRPLTQVLKDYAAIDVIVMIDIYEKLKTNIDQWESFQQMIETTIDLNKIIIYQCVCGERFITNKTCNKHIRTCYQAQTLEKSSKTKSSSINNDTHPIKSKQTHLSTQLDYDAPLPCGRGYLPPALKRAYQSMNQISLCEQIRSSSTFHEFNENRPPDAQFFLEDDDTEVAQAFGINLKNKISKPKINRIQSNVSYVSIPKPNLKIAAYPPKTTNSISSNISKPSFDENDLLERLKDDFDSQPEFHCHLFGLGGRGRSSSMHLSPPEPYLHKQHDNR